MLTLWHSLTSGRHACQDVWNCRGLEPRLRCSHNLLSDQNAVISSSWWPSLVLLMFWTDFLSFGEMFDLVYVNYCPSFLFFPISLERCKTKENINTSWLSIRWSPPGGMTWLLETKINNMARSCLFKLPWIPLEFSGSFQVNWISKLDMASWALNSFVNLFFVTSKLIHDTSVAINRLTK